jgi:hypothetical protein
MANIVAMQQMVADGINDNNVKAAQAQHIATLQAQLAAAAQPGWTTVANIERLTNWEIPPLVGNQAGINSPGVFTFTPGTATAPAVFTAAGKGPWANGYFLTRLGDHSAATRFRLSLEFRLPTAADLAGVQALECECQKSSGKLIGNMATQFDQAGKKTIRIFNFAAKVWEDTGIGFTLVAGQWTSFVAEFAQTDSAMTHIGIWLNGVWHSILASHPLVPVSGNPYFNAAWQNDSMGGNPPAPYSVEVRNYTVSLA